MKWYLVKTKPQNELRKRLDEDWFVQMSNYNRFRYGEQVRTKAGGLKNFEAVFNSEVSDNERVQILLGSLASAKRVRINPCYLERI